VAIVSTARQVLASDTSPVNQQLVTSTNSDSSPLRQLFHETNIGVVVHLSFGTRSLSTVFVDDPNLTLDSIPNPDQSSPDEMETE